ncbi:hypothetical protein [Prosthecobacter sp.]|uniref:hypothetical protein n=1 Tax=Prosthecobacter sp. TaxID=1965333 RepID=UPI0037848A53
MNRNLIALALTLQFALGTVSGQEGQPPPPPPPPPGGGGGIHVLPRGADKALNLTAEQTQQLKDLEAEVQAKVEKILTPAQLEQLKTFRPQPPGGGERPAAPDAKGATKRPPAEDAPKSVSQSLPAGVTRVPVEFTGGHETVPVDHGRPVKLIAAALGVQDEVFRVAFSNVHPAGPGSGGPSESEARANKAVLMNALGKHGVTNDRLNEVSNFYRYPPGSRNLWKNQPAAASALVKDGAIIGYEVTSGGYGYTTAPTVSVPGMNGAAAKVELAFGKDFVTNGSISGITVANAQ